MTEILLFFDYYSRLKRVVSKIELACVRVPRENEQNSDSSAKIALVFERPVFNETRRFNFRGV